LVYVYSFCCTTCSGSARMIWIPLGTNISKHSLILIHSFAGVVQPIVALNRSLALTFSFCTALYQIETVISSSPLFRPRFFHRRKMSTFDKCTPSRLESPNNAPLRLISLWTVIPRLFNGPSEGFRYYTRHIPRACRCITRIVVIRLDENPSGRTCTDECDMTRRAAIDSSRE